MFNKSLLDKPKYTVKEPHVRIQDDSSTTYSMLGIVWSRRCTSGKQQSQLNFKAPKTN